MSEVPPAIGADVPDVALLRRRGSRAVFGAVAVGTTAFVASVTVTPLVAEDLTGSATLSGIPWAAGVLGTGLGSAALGQLMARRGRGPGLVVGYAAGGLGAALAIAATVAGAFWAFVIAMLVMGAGNASNHQARYAVSELYPAERRAAALGMIVWAGTIGGVGGPALFAPSGSVARAFDLPVLTGPFLVALVGLVLAAAGLGRMLRRFPTALRTHEAPQAPSGATIFAMWRAPRAQAALVALAVSQTVMVLIMAMTPLHLRAHGHGLGPVGFVISVHVFGMYGLSPVSGWLSDRMGRIPTILLGFAMLVAAALSAGASPEHAGIALAGPLFLLGWGWSLSFVSASALLTEGLPYADRARLQGATDTVVWTSAAIAGVSSGVLVGAFNYAVLCVVGALLVVAPLVIIVSRRRAIAAAATA